MSVIPNHFFKFMPREFLEGFVSGRSVKIGTLSDYRKSEKYGSATLDGQEGQIEIEPGLNFGTLENPLDLTDSKYSQSLDFVNSASGNNFTGLKVVGPTESVFKVRMPDYHIFCGSLEFSPDIAEDLGEGNDTCVVIKNTKNFLYSISQALSKRVGLPMFPSCGPIIYANRNFTIESEEFSLNPFAKSDKYSIQREFRILFAPKSIDAEGHKLEPLKNINLEILEMDVEDSGIEVVWAKDNP